MLFLTISIASLQHIFGSVVVCKYNSNHEIAQIKNPLKRFPRIRYSLSIKVPIRGDSLEVSASVFVCPEEYYFERILIRCYV